MTRPSPPIEAGGPAADDRPKVLAMDVADGAADSQVLVVDLGEISSLTLGQGRGRSEDKRRAYN